MRINMYCRICGNAKKNKLYEIRERQLKNGDIFQYLYCNQCGTLQLNDKIKNHAIRRHREETFAVF